MMGAGVFMYLPIIIKYVDFFTFYSLNYDTVVSGAGGVVVSFSASYAGGWGFNSCIRQS